MSERLTDAELQHLQSVREAGLFGTDRDFDKKKSSVTVAPLPQGQTKPLDAAIQKHIDAYNALTIGEALNTAKSRRGDSKKEIAKLEALLEVRGVTKKTTVGEARKLREGK